MRALSGEAAGLITQLFTLYRSGDTHHAMHGCLEQIAGAGERRVVPLLLPLLADPAWRVDASLVIERLLQDVTPVELAAIDLQARIFSFTITHGSPVERWERLSPGDVPAIAAAVHASPATIGVLTMHGNGFVREAALRALDGCRDGREIPYLALRANDWVSDVAALATAMVRSRLVDANRRTVLRTLPFLLRLVHQGRRDHASLLARLDAVIAMSTDVRAVRLLAEIAGLPAVTRRAVYVAVWSRRPTADTEALQLALADRDMSCRLMAVRWLADSNDAGAVPMLAGAVTSDTAPTVRARALAALGARDGAAATQLLPSALLDSAATVRGVARYLVRALQAPIVPCDPYLHHVDDGRPRTEAAALEGLSEVGARDQLGLIVARLRSSSTRVRVAALRAVTRLDPALGVEEATTQIERGAGGAAAMRVPRSHPRRVDFARIAAARRAATSEATRARLLRVMATGPKWDVPVLLLDAAADGGQETPHRVAQLLREWLARFNNTQAAPTTAQRHRLEGALDDTRASRIPDALRTELRFALTAFD